MTPSPNDSKPAESQASPANAAERIAVARQGDVCVATLQDSRLVDAALVAQCKSELMSLVQEGQAAKLVIDFSVVEHASPIALSTLMILQKKLQSQGGKLCVCGLSSSMTEVLKVARLDRILTIHEGQAEAIASM